MARATKHTHVFRIVSHTMDFARVLVGCGATHCIEIAIWTQQTQRIKVAERKYRPASKQEFIGMLSELEHLCCA
jgi:hypothetical protein